jgi:glycosyltransferase involved in cell wall biosynthesis
VTGLLAAPDDLDALTAAVRALASDPQLRNRMAAQGRDRATANFALTRLVDDHARLYRELLAARS